MNQGAGGSKLDGALKRGEALLFSEQNYGGQEQLIKGDTPSLGPDFSATSIRMGPQTGVTLFSEENYQGVSQDLTTELASFADSRLKDQKPKSFKVWYTIGRPFKGYRAIEVDPGGYLSAAPDGVLTTSQEVGESETFRITRLDPKQGTVAFTMRGASLNKAPTSEQPPDLTIDDLQSVVLHNEPEAGFRKFSLLSADNRWIYYNPEQKRFQTTGDAKNRTIFYQSIKIAENEAQIGGLSQGEVVLYENRAYWGKAWVFCSDCADFTKVLGLNEMISSIQLGPQTGVTIYSEPQFNIGTNNPKAAKQDVTSNLPSLQYEQVNEDQISSMGLWKIVSPDGTGITFTCSLSQDFRGSGKTFQEYSAYRTILRLPPRAKNVDLWTTDETDIEVNGIIHRVSEDQPVSLPLISTKSLVIATDAAVPPRGGSSKGSLSAVGLKIRADTMLSHERIVIYPDQPVHERLANLEDEGDEEDKNKDTLWNATYVTYDKKGKRVENPVIKDRSGTKHADVANAQGMITKVMSTVKYSSDASGGLQRTISAEALGGKAWVLDFLTYRVTAETLYVREGPDPKSKQVGFLRKNDVVEVLGFNVGAGWTRLRRPADGLTGWSSSTYLSQIPETPAQGEQYRVTAKALHVRKGPGVEFGSLGYIQQDEIVTTIGVNDEGTWKKIVRSDGLIGWSSARYMSPVQPLTPETPSRKAATPRRTRSLDKRAVALKMAIPAMSELTPQVSFREISQDDVQALLARVKSPGVARFLGLDLGPVDDLVSDAGDGIADIGSEIGSALSDAASFVWTKLDDGMTFLIDLGDRVIKFVVDTAEKAIAAVEGIIEKIGAVIEEIIKWIRFLLEWEDILDTRDYLYNSLIKALDYAGNTLSQKAQGPVSEFLNDKKDLLIGWIDEAIVALGGSLTDTSSGGSSGGGAQMPEALEWILSKVTSGLGALGPSTNFDLGLMDQSDVAAKDRLQKLWDETLVEAAEMISTALGNLPQTIISLVEHLDDPREMMVDLLRMVRNQLDRLLEMGEKIVLGLFELAGFLCKKIKELLRADIYIPLISDLINWVGDLLGVDLSCSVLDIATLILAVPVTIICKAALGEAPFKNAPTLALGVQEDKLVAAYGILSGVANCEVALMSLPLDTQPEKETQPLWEAQLELLCLTTAAIGGISAWIGSGLAGDLDESNENSWLSKLLLTYDVSILLMDVGCMVVGLLKSPKIAERTKRRNEPTIWIASGLGVFHLILLIIQSTFNKKVEEAIPDCLMTLPEIGSALRLYKNPQVIWWGFGIIDAIAAAAAIASIVVTAVDA